MLSAFLSLTHLTFPFLFPPFIFSAKLEKIKILQKESIESKKEENYWRNVN